MGQYHLFVNLDKREFVHPHKLGDGLKLAEQLSGGKGSTAAAAVLLLSAPADRGGGDVSKGKADGVAGRWHGDRVAWVGDYAQDDDLPGIYPPASIIYTLCVERDLTAFVLNQRIAAEREDHPPLARHYNAVAAAVELYLQGGGEAFTDVSPFVVSWFRKGQGVEYDLGEHDDAWGLTGRFAIRDANGSGVAR